MKRPVLFICVDCSTEANDAPGNALFRAVKKERRKRGLKPLLKVEKARCLDRCDTPCNAELREKHKPTLQITRLDCGRDAVALLEAAVRYAEAEGEPSHQSVGLPGRPG